MSNSSITLGQRLFKQLDINLDEVPFEQLVNYTAVEYFLTVEDEPSSDVTNLEKVRRYLESFHHLCEVKDWENSYKVMSCPLNTSSQKQLHYQLDTWGYYTEQITIYDTLLNKLDNEVNYICLKGLGNAYQNLAEYKKAINYFQQSLSIAEQINDPIKIADTLSNLGAISGKLRNWQASINYLEKSKTIIQNYHPSDFEGSNEKQRIEANILGNFGSLYGNQRKFTKAREYLEESLRIAQQIEDNTLQASATNNLGNICGYLKDYELALTYFQQFLDSAIKSENANLQQQAYNNLGNLYRLTKQYDLALEYLEKSLKINKDIGNRGGETIALENLGVVYGKLGDYEQAIKYSQDSLNLAKTIGDKQGILLGRVNLGIARFLYWWKNLFKIVYN